MKGYFRVYKETLTGASKSLWIQNYFMFQLIRKISNGNTTSYVILLGIRVKNKSPKLTFSPVVQYQQLELFRKLKSVPIRWRAYMCVQTSLPQETKINFVLGCLVMHILSLERFGTQFKICWWAFINFKMCSKLYLQWMSKETN